MDVILLNIFKLKEIRICYYLLKDNLYILYNRYGKAY